MKQTYKITTTDETTIIIDNNVIEKIATFVGGKNYSSFFIITDETANKLFVEKIKENLLSLQKPIEMHILPNGEDSKSIQQLFRILEHLIEKNFDRKSAIISVGGGVIGDIATTTAGIFLRGVDCIQVPTTLLSQVDAAIGGKGAVNFRQYKNVIGVIKQPAYIIIDPTILENLPDNQIRSGMGEVLKYAISLDENLFTLLMENDKPLQTLFPSIVETCVKIKMELVINDPQEKTGIRQLVNFGHTLGHAIELYAHIPHGEAVSIGIVFAAIVSNKMGMIDKTTTDKIISLLKKYKLPINLNKKDITKNVILEHMKKDKKSIDGVPLFVLLEGIGKAKTGCIVPKNIIEETLEEMLI